MIQVQMTKACPHNYVYIGGYEVLEAVEISRNRAMLQQIGEVLSSLLQVPVNDVYSFTEIACS